MYISDFRMLKKRCIGDYIDENQENDAQNIEKYFQEIQAERPTVEEINLTSAGLYTLKGIQFVVNTHAVKILWLSENPLCYLAGLQSFTDLEELNIDYCKIKSLEPLRKLSKLRKLSADSNQIMDLEPLSELMNLEWLDVGFNQVSSLNGLQNLKHLVYLDVDKNKISNVEELDKLKPCKGLRKLCIKSQLEGNDNPVVEYASYVKQQLPQITHLDVDAELNWLTI